MSEPSSSQDGMACSSYPPPRPGFYPPPASALYAARSSLSSGQTRPIAHQAMAHSVGGAASVSADSASRGGFVSNHGELSPYPHPRSLRHVSSQTYLDMGEFPFHWKPPAGIVHGPLGQLTAYVARLRLMNPAYLLMERKIWIQVFECEFWSVEGRCDWMAFCHFLRNGCTKVVIRVKKTPRPPLMLGVTDQWAQRFQHMVELETLTMVFEDRQLDCGVLGNVESTLKHNLPKVSIMVVYSA